MTLNRKHSADRRPRWHRLAAVGGVTLLALAAFASLNQLAQASSAVGISRINFVDLGTENFENPANQANWTLTGPTGPRWTFISSSSPWKKTHSGTRAIWFGDPLTGEFGGEGCDFCPVYSGSATFNVPIPIPSVDTFAYFTFWSYERTEISIFPLECYQDPVCPFDARQVWISGTLSPGWVLKWNSQSNATVENVWNNKIVDISEYIGQSIRFRFVFNTVDGRNNDAGGSPPAGWFVDDIRLFTFTPSSRVSMPIISRNSAP